MGTGAWVQEHGYRGNTGTGGTWVQGEHGYRGTQVRGYRGNMGMEGTWVQGNMGTRIYEEHGGGGGGAKVGPPTYSCFIVVQSTVHLLKDVQ